MSENNDERGDTHYPTDEELARVKGWKVNWLNDGTFPLYGGWFKFIRSLWWMPSWGWSEFDGKEEGDPIHVFNISTGGWSGNEDIINAMAENFINWSQTFYVHKRGGHYEFRIPRLVA